MDEREKTNEELRAENEVLKSLVAAMTSEIMELRARLNKNSRNSGKPPSSDGYRKPVVKNSRETSGKPSGGQKGHAGHTKPLKPTPQKIIELKPQTECSCGGEIIIDTERYTVRQVSDIPPVEVITIEYRAHEGICARCGKVHKASFPERIKNAPTSYGERMEAIVTYLTNYQLIPLKRTTELMSDLFNVQISQGTVVRSGQEAYERLEEPEAIIKEEIKEGEVANFDESGMRVNGKTWWLHSASTQTSTVYIVHEKRGKEAMDEMGILPEFKGTAIHDHWMSYYHYSCAHGECNEHHLRHLKYLHEELGQEWACEMAALLLRIKLHVDLSRVFGAQSLSHEDIAAYEIMYRKILTTASESGEEMPLEAKRMTKRLTNYEQETLLFMVDFNIPFTNNLAERDIRMPKAKQKISGGLRTESGAKAFARIRGFISTLKKRGKNVLDGLTATFNGQASEFLSNTSAQI
jgi:transposase